MNGITDLEQFAICKGIFEIGIFFIKIAFYRINSYVIKMHKYIAMNVLLLYLYQFSIYKNNEIETRK